MTYKLDQGEPTSVIRTCLGWVAGALALGIALTGIANSAPSFWIIPSIGPFKSEYIRPLIVFLAVTVILIRFPVSAVLTVRVPSVKLVAWSVDLAIFAAAIWVF